MRTAEYFTEEASRTLGILAALVAASLVEWLRYRVGVHKYSTGTLAFAYIANTGLHLWHRPNSIMKGLVASSLSQASMPGLLSLIAILFWTVEPIVAIAIHDFFANLLG